MTTATTAAPLAEALLPQQRLTRLAGRIALIVLGAALIALSAKVTVPMWPVAISLQTLAVLVIAGLYGRTLAVLTLVAYLAEGALGLPVFQGTPEKGIGLAYMSGPTAGYLLGFVAMAAIVGHAVDRGWGRRPLLLFGAMLAGELLLILFGAGWLSVLFGLEIGLASGFGVFVIPDLVKVALATCLVTAAARLP